MILYKQEYGSESKIPLFSEQKAIGWLDCGGGVNVFDLLRLRFPNKPVVTGGLLLQTGFDARVLWSPISCTHLLMIQLFSLKLDRWREEGRRQVFNKQTQNIFHFEL